MRKMVIGRGCDALLKLVKVALSAIIVFWVVPAYAAPTANGEVPVSMESHVAETLSVSDSGDASVAVDAVRSSDSSAETFFAKQTESVVSDDVQTVQSDNAAVQEDLAQSDTELPAIESVDAAALATDSAGDTATAPAKQTVADGDYVVRSLDDPYRVLDIMGGSSDDGANLALYRLSGVSWQRFAFAYDGEGYYTVTCASSGKALACDASGAGERGDVCQRPADGSDCQKWAVVDAGDGCVRLRCKATGLYLDVEGGRAGDSVNVRTWEATDNNSGRGQGWKLESAPSYLVSEGTYVVESLDDSVQVLDIMGSSTSDGANAALYENRNSANQKFSLVEAGDGWYRLVAEHSGQCLDVVAGGTSGGTNVTQWPTTWAGNQLWAVEDAGDGWYRLRAGCSGLYLDVEGGHAGNSVNVRTWERTDNNCGAGQKFRFGRMIDDGIYFVGSADDGSKVLDVVAGSREDGANVTLWDRTGASNQRFEIRRLYGRVYKVSCCRSWRALDVVAGGKENGTNVTQWSQYDTDNQSWLIDVLDDGSVTFRSIASDLYLDVQGGHAGAGVNVQTWERTDNNSGLGQQWRLERTPFHNPGMYAVGDGTYRFYNDNGDLDRGAAIGKLISTANSLLGVPYVWLGVYPQDGGMDCASFTWYLYKQLGIDIGFETYDQMYSGVGVGSLSEARPGDLVLMYDNGWPNYVPGLFEHVVLYAGNGMIYEEPTFGGQCQYVSIYSKGMGNISIRRIIAD